MAPATPKDAQKPRPSGWRRHGRTRFDLTRSRRGDCSRAGPVAFRRPLHLHHARASSTGMVLRDRRHLAERDRPRLRRRQDGNCHNRDGGNRDRRTGRRGDLFRARRGRRAVAGPPMQPQCRAGPIQAGGRGPRPIPPARLAALTAWRTGARLRSAGSAAAMVMTTSLSSRSAQACRARGRSACSRRITGESVAGSWPTIRPGRRRR